MYPSKMMYIGDGERFTVTADPAVWDDIGGPDYARLGNTQLGDCPAKPVQYNRGSKWSEGMMLMVDHNTKDHHKFGGAFKIRQPNQYGPCVIDFGTCDSDGCLVTGWKGTFRDCGGAYKGGNLRGPTQPTRKQETDLWWSNNIGIGLNGLKDHYTCFLSGFSCLKVKFRETGCLVDLNCKKEEALYKDLTKGCHVDALESRVSLGFTEVDNNAAFIGLLFCILVICLVWYFGSFAIGKWNTSQSTLEMYFLDNDEQLNYVAEF